MDTHGDDGGQALPASHAHQTLSDLLAFWPTVDREIGIDVARVGALAASLDRKGKVVIELTVEPTSSRVLVKIGHKVTDPRPDPEARIFHVTSAGLSEDDPRQGRLNLNGRSVDTTTGELPNPDRPNEEPF